MISQPKALFLSNSKYIDPLSQEGGVKLCTQEYIALIRNKFDIIYFPVEIHQSLFYKVKAKLRMNAYDDYKVSTYEKQLRQVITEYNIQFVFLNLTNTIVFSKLIKTLFPSIKVILCSHGNESGDFLHEIVMHYKAIGIRKRLQMYTLGKMLTLESLYRKYIDLVLTVSDVELNIEKWLGANNVYMVARVIAGKPIDHHPKPGKIGFFGDLSHEPNTYGLKRLCYALKKYDTQGINLSLVGSNKLKGIALEKEFSFITYLGYLPEDELIKEISTWTFFLNPVFYYSRGVSTKLGKALSLGLPVITTLKGMRGYKWKEGKILSCDTPDEMATLILQNATNIESSFYYRTEILKLKYSSPSLEEMMIEIYELLLSKN